MDGPDGSEPNLYIAWYEAWRAEGDARRAAEAAARRDMQREVRCMIGFLVGWSVAAAAAGAIALALWTGGVSAPDQRMKSRASSMLAKTRVPSRVSTSTEPSGRIW